MIGRRVIDDQMPDVVQRPAASRRRRVLCFIGLHDWCGRVDLGADAGAIGREAARRATLTNYSQSVIDEFFRFAAPVCRYCPKQLPPWRPS